MSNVLMRKRSISELEFWKTGSEIRAALTRFLMSENNVPKRWRPVFTFPGIDLARRLMEEVTAANTIYPTNVAELEQRRHFPKGTNFDNITDEEVAQVTEWLNRYPRKILNWGNSQQCFNLAVSGLCSTS